MNNYNDNSMISMVLVITAAMLGVFVNYLRSDGDSLSEREQANADIRSGYIIDKDIISPRTTFFYSTDTEYRIYVSSTWEHDGDNEEITRYFTVSENVYNSYDIGDYFDVRNYNAEE